MTGIRHRSRTQQRALRFGILITAALGTSLLLAAHQPSLAKSRSGACELTPAAFHNSAVATEPATIRVTVENVRSSDGLITAVLYPENKKSFLKEGERVDKVRIAAQEGDTILCMRAPSLGRYSIALYHDENGNRDFDRNFIGIPTEGYGFSQNPGFRFGKPNQEETLFTIELSLTEVRISVLYL